MCIMTCPFGMIGRAAVPDELAPAGYRVIAVSIYTPEADWIDQTTQALKQAGNQKANRSLVVREAILRLQESLEGKSAPDVLTNFTEHEARRSKQN